jgi:drug/metabolite transporter (DMT)-like permease
MESLLGAFAALAAAVSWAIGICLFKKHGGSCSPMFLTFFKGMVGCLSIGILLVLFHPPFPTNSTHVLALVISGIIGITIGDTAAYFALQKIGAQISATAFSLSTPIAAMLAFVFLGERLTAREAFGMSITTLAVVAVLSEAAGLARTRDLRSGIAAAILSPLSHALGIILSKHALEQTNFLWGITLRLVPATVPFLFVFAFQTKERTGSTTSLNRAQAVGLTIGSLVGGTIGFLLLTFAIQTTKAGIAAAISATYPIWVTPCAVFLLGEKARLVHVVWTVVAAIGISLMVFS